MSEWREHRFSDFVDVNPRVLLPKDESISFVEMKDLNESIRYCVASQEKNLSGGSRFEERDTLFARITPCLENGKICQVKRLKNGKGFGSTEFHVFRGRDKISDSDFVYYLSRWDDVRSHAEINLDGTSGRQRVPKQAFDDLILTLPPLAEQRAIAEVLGSLDDKIDLLHRQNATLEKMAETLFRQWFIEQAKPEWEEKSLKEVTDIAIGRTPPRKEFHWFSNNPLDVKWISIKDLGNDGIFISNTSEYLTRDAVKAFKIPVIPSNTVVLSFKMTVGRVAISSETMTSNEAIAHFRFNNETPFTKEYLYIFLKTYPYDILGSTSSIVTAINSAMIKDIQILIPDNTTMELFRQKSEPLFIKIKSNQQQIRTLTTLRDTLLPKLMSGEVRVEI
ncbi:MAG: restriction endonuclease subunit S [Alistipes sp.]|nr:restriction endonuclease subunit S [Alistipes sp.]